MKLIRVLLIFGLPVALLLAANVDASSLIDHPRAPLLFILFWGTLIAFPRYLERSHWHDQGTFGNIFRWLTPMMAAAGAAAALAGVAMTSWWPETLGSAVDSNTSLGLGLVWFIATVAAPFAATRNKRVVGGAQRPAFGADPDVGDVVERALELEAGTGLNMDRDERDSVARAVGVSAASMDRAAKELSEHGLIRSQPPPPTSLEGEPAAGKDG